MGYRAVGVYHNRPTHTIPRLPSILEDRNLCRLGGVSYGVDTSHAVYEATLKPQDTRRSENDRGGWPKVYLTPVYHIPPTISIISILPNLSSIIQDREISPGYGSILSFVFDRPSGKVAYVSHTCRAEYEIVLANCAPNDTHMSKYHMGGIPAGGVYPNPTRPYLHCPTNHFYPTGYGSILTFG